MIAEFETPKLDRDIERRAAAGHHWEILAAKLGNGAEWEYRGECGEADKPVLECACTHPIKRWFRIHHPDGRSLILGCVCIEHYEDTNPALVAAVRLDIERMDAERAEAKRRAREMAQDDAIARMIDALDAILWQINAKLLAENRTTYRRCGWSGYEADRRVCYGLYNWRFDVDRAREARKKRESDPSARHPLARFKAYKSKAAFKRAVQARIDEFAGYAARPWASEE